MDFYYDDNHPGSRAYEGHGHADETVREDAGQGAMMGMFEGNKGTLNGIKPGRHTLELRVATGDHNQELNATDKLSFTTK